jgi:arginyl-tRNA synthetase
MDNKQLAAKALLEVLEKEPFNIKKSLEEIERALETPKDPSHGDHAFPCFILAKDLRKAPQAIAKEIAENLGESDAFSKILAVGPYLNFTDNKSQMAGKVVPAIISGEFLKRRASTGQKTMIEYSQPNTHKAFHVGHTRNVALGDALVRICDWSGDEVVAANYIGDVGTHIAKCLWQYLEQGAEYNEASKLTRGEFLGSFYSEADKLLDFKLLSEVPIPKVVTARVEKVESHPSNPKWSVIKVTDGDSNHQIVCGAKRPKSGDIVALALPGARIGGRTIEVGDKEGTESQGVLCSEKELGIGEDNETLYTFSESVALGVEVAEHFRRSNIEPKDKSVSEIIAEREGAVSLILQKLEKGDKEISDIWSKTRQWSLDDFNAIYTDLNARFDHFFYESELVTPSKEIVKDYLERGVFVHSEGAVGINLEKHKLPFMLVRKSDGTGLYATKDLALAKVKFDKFGVDKSIYVVDTSQSLHFQQVFATLTEMGYKQAEKCFHLAYGMVVLPDGKMSSRKGTVILYSELKERLDTKIRSQFLDKYKGDWPQEEIDLAAKSIAVATIKYGMLNQDNRKNIVFDLDEWSSQTGNTGPYLLYAYSRTRSILRELENRIGDFSPEMADWSLMSHETELNLLRKINQFPETVQRAYERYEPQAICIYLYELAKGFSRMYDACSVIHAKSDELKITRAYLVDAFGLTLKKGLELIGIETIDRM